MAAALDSEQLTARILAATTTYMKQSEPTEILRPIIHALTSAFVDGMWQGAQLVFDQLEESHRNDTVHPADSG